MEGPTIQQAFDEACQALGESIVRERLMGKEIARLTSDRTTDPHESDDEAA